MKNLLVLRHAKSDWASGADSDLDRPLAPRGRKAANTVGRMIARSGRVPDRVLCSPAARTRETLARATAAGEWQAPTEIEPVLYEEGVAELLERIHATPDDCETLLIVGHQPTLGALLSLILGGARVRFPTAALASLLVAAWPELGAGRCELEWLLVPRLLRRLERS